MSRGNNIDSYSKWQIGLGCKKNCIDENDFLENSVQLINEIQKYDDIDHDDVFSGNPPPMSEFQSALIRILDNIAELKKIPTEKRTYD